MNKAETIKGPSCLTNAEDDEPLFILRANDELAPNIIRIWATRYHDSKLSEHGDVKGKHLRKYREALDLADQMAVWRARNNSSRSPT